MNGWNEICCWDVRAVPDEPASENEQSVHCQAQLDQKTQHVNACRRRNFINIYDAELNGWWGSVAQWCRRFKVNKLPDWNSKFAIWNSQKILLQNITSRAWCCDRQHLLHFPAKSFYIAGTTHASLAIIMIVIIFKALLPAPRHILG